VNLNSHRALTDYLCASTIDVIVLIETNLSSGTPVLVQKIRCDPVTEETPLVIIGPRGDTEMIDALTAGADVYLDHSATSELVAARIQALLRRVSISQRLVTNQSFGAYTFPAGTDHVCLDGVPVWLTRMEYRASLLLFTRLFRVVTFEDLWMTMWEGLSRQDPQRHNICVHISRMRHKLKLDGEYGYRLISVRGLGYKLVVVENHVNIAALSQVVNC
jgi:DNA-binding response OmpR family regulator